MSYEISIREWYCLAVGVLVMEKEALIFEESIIKIQKKNIHLLEEKREQKYQLVPKPKISDSLVVTLPFRMGVNDSMSSTIIIFRNLIESTQKELFIVSPFLEREGVQALHTSFLTARRNACKVKLLTRGILSLNQALGLRDLFITFGDRISVKAFHAQATEGYQHQVESTHAKILLSDRKSLYLGSAGIRANALFNNFEVGTHTTDPVIISSILKILHLVWNDIESCRIINREDVEQRIRFGLRTTHT
jgi:phosphatidylserine/phosphatidylglycerophosphate/cardiolipin synthase-like enzyme